MTDELLQPSVTNPPGPRGKPWRVSSQVWVAFFGGILAITVIAILNARRLGIDNRKRWLMGAAGTVALAILLALWLRQPGAPDYQRFLREGGELRIAGRVIALVLYLILAAIQKPAERHYLVFEEGEYASLWTAGLAYTVILGTLQSTALPLIAWTASR